MKPQTCTISATYWSQVAAGKVESICNCTRHLILSHLFIARPVKGSFYWRVLKKEETQMKGSSQLALRLIPVQELCRISIQQDSTPKSILQHLSGVPETSVSFQRIPKQGLGWGTGVASIWPVFSQTACVLYNEQEGMELPTNQARSKSWGGTAVLCCSLTLKQRQKASHTFWMLNCKPCTSPTKPSAPCPQSTFLKA